MMTTRMLTIAAALSFLMVLGHPSTVRAEVCEEIGESYRTGRPITISGTVLLVNNKEDLFSIPGVRGYGVSFISDCGYLSAEGRGLAPCQEGQNIEVRGVAVEINIGVLFRVVEILCTGPPKDMFK